MDSQAQQIRQVIDDFINERLQGKLAALKDEDGEKREKLRHDYRRETWLENAARRVSQIRLITHALKYMHPDARGTSVHYSPERPLGGPWVGSATEARRDDVVGNAAALDVFKFLKLEVGGQTLLQRAQSADAMLHAAFCEDSERARVWCEAFAGITQAKEAPASHALAKQIYFPLGDGNYHLLSPLYPTSLTQNLYDRIQRDRFSDDAKVARKARRADAPSTSGYREHPQLAVQKFGGSNRQNISQLNSERGGTGYLLPSLPPSWRRQFVKPPLQVTTVFSRWMDWGELKSLPQELRRYLEQLPKDRTNVHIRRARARRINDIVDVLLNRAAAIQQLPAGWSSSPECRLDLAEALWLDPVRAANDEAFALQYRESDWPDQVSHRFGNWLNGRLHSDRLHVGDSEYAAWKNELQENLSWLTRELDDER